MNSNKPINTRIFPYTLARVSGGSIDELHKLNFPEASKLIDDYYRIQKELNTLKDIISEKLYSFIPTLDSSISQNKALTLRRDIFNDRKIAKEKIEDLSSFLPNDIFESIHKYYELNIQKSKVYSEGEELYIKKMKKIKPLLNEIISDEIFQKGLLLSSQDILDRIPSYIKEGHLHNNKNHQVELGLLKYITRMYTKTSPFSTFTNLAIAKHDIPFGKNDSFITSKEKSIEVTSHIRLNNLFFQYLKTLLLKNPDIYHWFKLRPNPTINQIGGAYLLLTNFNNLDVFQRIEINPALEIIYKFCKSENQGIIYSELISKILSENDIDASTEEIDDYLYQLIDFGFLEYNIGVSGTDADWDIHLQKKLQYITHPLICELISVLGKLRDIANEYAKSDLAGRKRLINTAYTSFRGICMKLHEAAGLPEDERKSREEIAMMQLKMAKEFEEAKKKKKDEKDLQKQDENIGEGNEKKEEHIPYKNKSNTYFYFKPESIFYEDTVLNQDLQLDPTLLNENVSKIIELEESLAVHNTSEEELIKMGHFFDVHYAGRENISLLDFYESYYRLFKKVEKSFNQKPGNENQQNKETGNNLLKEKPEILNIKALEELKICKNTWNELFIKSIQDCNNHQVNISLKDIYQVNAEMNIQPEDIDATSKGVFVQFFLENENQTGQRLMGVLNSGFPGLMKLMGRFLHIFDTEVLETAREYNLSLQASNVLLAEDRDASYFNANLHPPLLPHEIWMPNSNTDLPENQQILVTDIVVTKKGQRVILIHKPTGKELQVYDLGLQGPGGRSELFQLLDKFNNNRVSLWFSLINNVYSKNSFLEKANHSDIKDKVFVRPRIIVDNQVVISRKTWFIPKSKIPSRQPGENDWAYFLKVNCWAKEYELPDEVFVNIIYRDQKPENEEQAKLFKNIGRDDYKPQYINFKNPYMVSMFEKLAYKVPIQMFIVEMLPNSKQLVEIENKKYVTEYLVQWYQTK